MDEESKDDWWRLEMKVARLPEGSECCVVAALARLQVVQYDCPSANLAADL